MKVLFNPNGLTRQGSDLGLGIENFGHFMIFELLKCDILHLLNFKCVAHEGP